MSQQDAQDRFATRAHAPFPRPSAHRNRGAETAPDDRLQRLIDRLPKSWQKAVRWLRRPASRWARIPAGLLLIVGGCLAILPIFGLWMIPLGLVLLADDIPLLARLRGRMLDWIERHRPGWFSPRPKLIGNRREP